MTDDIFSFKNTSQIHTVNSTDTGLTKTFLVEKTSHTFPVWTGLYLYCICNAVQKLNMSSPLK